MKHGANINAQNKNHHTPLMVAVKNGHEKITDLLLEKKANVLKIDENGYTVLHHASQNGSLYQEIFYFT